ncbi:hypothetical protein BDU57DRAFT_524580 [Ampelomyces quisqualis]|uniref:Uncharacterized protein n=1 Tax=Ampelomyces quisqualis TaxID=50730 RepID=A0A6A5Q7F7_AMPQU|nr:hypothetical protein BDU57DRAFT_524580 [Ampelomyces quisqualis]
MYRDSHGHAYPPPHGSPADITSAIAYKAIKPEAKSITACSRTSFLSFSTALSHLAVFGKQLPTHRPVCSPTSPRQPQSTACSSPAPSSTRARDGMYAGRQASALSLSAPAQTKRERAPLPQLRRRPRKNAGSAIFTTAFPLHPETQTNPHRRPPTAFLGQILRGVEHSAFMSQDL